MRIKNERIKPLTQTDIEELKFCLATDLSSLEAARRILFLTLFFALLLTGFPIKGWATMSWDDYVIKFFILSIPPTLVLLWINRPIYQIMVQTKSDVAFIHKRTFITTIEQKNIDKKTQLVKLITSNQDEFTIAIAGHEKYVVGDQVYAELAASSKLPLKIESLKNQQLTTYIM